MVASHRSLRQASITVGGIGGMGGDKTSKTNDTDDLNDPPPKIVGHFQDGEENSDGDLSSSMMTTTETDCTISPTISHQHLALSRQVQPK